MLVRYIDARRSGYQARNLAVVSPLNAAEAARMLAEDVSAVGGGEPIELPGRAAAALDAGLSVLGEVTTSGSPPVPAGLGSYAYV